MPETIAFILLPPGVAGLVANNGLIIPVPEAIDMLSCSFNREERLYALEKSKKWATINYHALTATGSSSLT